MKIVDTHCHLDFDSYDKDLNEVIDRAKREGVKAFVIPGADPADLPRAVEISQRYKEVFFAVGVHPYDADNYEEEYLKKYIEHPKCVAVGECGLDYYRLPKDDREKERIKKRQKEVFIAQIDLAKRYKKPLIVHIREASADSLEILKEHADPTYGGVLHCYNASEILLELANMGFYYGIGGVLTFKNAKKLLKVVPKIPIDKIVLETDSPFLTPHPYRGKRNEPAYTALVASKLSQILDKDLDSICEITTKNAARLFRPLEKIV